MKTRLNGDEIRVSVNERGNIYLSRSALDALNGPEAVVLLYDREHRTIGIMRAAADRRNAHRLKKKDRRGRGMTVYAADFLRHYDVKLDRTMAFKQPILDENGFLVLDLNTLVPINGPN